MQCKILVVDTFTNTNYITNLDLVRLGLDVGEREKVELYILLHIAVDNITNMNRKT